VLKVVNIAKARVYEIVDCQTKRYLFKNKEIELNYTIKLNIQPNTKLQMLS